MRKELGYNEEFASQKKQIFPRGFEANNRIIARHANRPDVEPQDPLTVSEAFGRGKWEKLVRMISSEELEHRLKCVNQFVAEFEVSNLLSFTVISFTLATGC